MNVVYTDEFRKQFEKLPTRIQNTYRSQEALFRISSRDPRLHVKKLKGYPTVFSFASHALTEHCFRLTKKI